MTKARMIVSAAIFTWPALAWATDSAETPKDARTVLRMIPADLPLAVVVVDFEKLDRNISSFVKRLDVGAADPGVLADVKDELDIGDWMDFTAPFGLAAVQLDPTTEAKAWWGRVPGFAAKAKSINGATKQDGVWHLPLSQTSQLYARTAGDYVIAANTRSALEQVTQGGESLADDMGPRADLLEGRDVLMHVNMERMRDSALGALAQTAQMLPLMAMMTAQQAGSDPAFMTAILSSAVDAGRNFVKQVTYIDISLAMNANAADVTIATGYREGPIQHYLATQKPASVAPFTQLEDQPYLVAMSYHVPRTNSPFVDYVIDRLVSAITVSLAQNGTPAPPTAPASNLDPEQVRQIARWAREIYHAIEGVDLVMAMSPDGLQVSGDYIGEDPRAILRLTKEALTSENPLFARFKGGTRYEALGARQIGEITVDQYLLKRDPAHATSGLFDPDSRFAVAVVGGRLRVGVGNDDTMQRAFSARITRPLSSSPQVRATLAALPPKRNGIVLIDPAAALPILGPMLGRPDVATLPPGPPVAISLSLSGEPARLDLHIPLRAIERLVLALSPQDPT